MIVQELVATLGLEVNEQAFDRGLLALKGLGLGLAGIGAAVGTAVVGIGALVHGTASAATEVRNLSATANVGTDFFQGLAFAAREVGFEIDDLRDVFLDVSERALDAKDGAEEYTKVYKALGVTVTDTSGKLKDGETLLREIANGFAKMPEGAERAALASKLLGETGARLLPVLLQGSEGLDAYTKSAREAGFVISTDVIKSSIEFNKQSGALAATLEGLRNEIGGELLGDFAAVMKVVTAWIRENRKMITQPVIKFFRGLGAVVKFVADNFDTLKGVLLLVGSFMLASYLPLLASVTSAQAAWGMAALISGARAAAGWALATAAGWLALAPVALLIAAIVLLADEIWTFAEGGDTLLGRWIKWLDGATDGSSVLLEVFKALGSVIFDLTDPKKWERLGRAIYAALLVPVEKLMDGLRWVKGVISNTRIGFSDQKYSEMHRLGDTTVSDVVPDFIENTRVGMSGQPYSQMQRVGDLWGPNSASPSATLAASSSSVYSPNVNAQVTVNVGENATPRETGDAVAKAVTGEWWTAPDYSANLVAVDQ